MQLATRMITDENTLPFYAGLIEISERPMEDMNRFHARARKRLDADKKKQDPLRHIHGSTGCKLVWPEDPLFELAWEEWYVYAMRNGEPVAQIDTFPHIWLNVDHLIGHDMSNNKWLDSTISDLKASILEFAITIGHEFAHAMVLTTLDGLPEPRFNEESVNETGFSWENFVFGGTPETIEGKLYLVLWPNFTNWKHYADNGDLLQLSGLGRGALPLRQYHCVDEQKWQRLLEQSFWDQTDKKAFKKFWLCGGDIMFLDAYLSEGGEVSASPLGKRVCLDEVVTQRRRVHAIRKKGLQAFEDRPDRWSRCVDRSEERRAVFHEFQGKSLLDQAWSDCTKHYDGNIFLGGATSGADH